MRFHILAAFLFCAVVSGNPTKDVKDITKNSTSEKGKTARQMNYNDVTQSQQSQATANAYAYNSANQDAYFQQQYNNPAAYSSLYAAQPSTYSSFGFQPNLNPYNPQLSTSGNFAIADSGVIFWGVTFLFGLLLALWVVSLITGKSLTHMLGTNVNAITSRAQEWGFKINPDDLNRLSEMVTSAIDAYHKMSETKNA